MTAKKYRVLAKEVHRFEYVVDADNRDHAVEQVERDLGVHASSKWTDGFRAISVQDAD